MAPLRNPLRALFFLSVFLFLFCAANPCPPEAQAQPEIALAITHVTVIDVNMGRASPDQTVVLLNSRIARMGAAAKVAVPANARLVDGTGKFLLPGLWDMHVHLAGITSDPRWSAPLLGVLLAHGITGVRDMGGSLPDLQRWRTEIEAGRMAGPRIVACGPMLDGDKNQLPLSLAADTPQHAHESAAKIHAMGGDFIKILNRVPKDAYREVAAYSKAQHLPFVGHIPLEVGAAAASDAGQKSIEHLEDLQLSCAAHADELRRAILTARVARDRPALEKLSAQIVETFDVKTSEKLFAKFRRNRTWQVPTQVWTRAMATMDKIDPEDPNLKYLPASVTQDWTQEKLNAEYTAQTRAAYRQKFEKGKELVKRMHAAGLGLLAGSDSIDPFVFTGAALQEELALFVEEGLTPTEALQTATRNPAQFFGYKDLGAVAPGKYADLLLLDADPRHDIHNIRKIASVVRAGKLFTRADLDRFLADAKQAAADYHL